jgi:branched-chain amino acid transport system substrate-binding protein
MKNVRKFKIAALAVIALSTSAISAVHAEMLKIGVIAPLSGPGAPWGMAGKVAADIVAGEVNAKGGLEVGGKKYQIQIIAYDDQYKAAEAVAAYNRLLNQDGVKYLMIATSAPTMALKKNVEDDKVIALTSSYSPAAIDQETKYMFRLYSSSADFMPGYAKWIKDNVKGQKLLSLNPNDETGWGHSKITMQAFKDVGFDVIGSELYERSTKDFAPLLTKTINLQPDIIDLGSSSPATAAVIVRQARDLGYKGVFAQTGGAGWSSIVQAAGKAGAEGLINILYADPENAAYRNLVEKYTKVVGQAPNEIIVPYYDAYNVLLRAIQKAGDVDDTTKVARAFPEVLPFKSVQGDDITWAHQQLRTYDYVGVLTDGRPVVKGKVK